MPISRRRCAPRCGTWWSATTNSSAAPESWTSSICCFWLAIWCARMPKSAAICRTDSRTSSSMSFRTPILCRPSFCCCSPPTIRPNPTGWRRRPNPASCSRWAIRSSRSINSAAPTWCCIATFATGWPRARSAWCSSPPASARCARSRSASTRHSRPRCRTTPLPVRPPIRRSTATRPAIDGQPNVVTLPVPRPYGSTRVSKMAINECLPGAIVAYVEWLTRESGWKVRDPEDPATAGPAVAPAHLHPLPQVHESRRRHHARLCPQPGGARDSASAGRVEIVSRPRRSGDAAGGAQRHRVAG